MLQSKEEVCRPLLLLHTTAYYFVLLHSTAYLCILLTLLQSREQERPSYYYIRQHSSDTTAFSCILLDIAKQQESLLLHTAYYCILLHPTAYYCILGQPKEKESLLAPAFYNTFLHFAAYC